MKNYFPFIWEIFKVVIVALAIVIPIRYFLFQPFIVRGESMLPSFYPNDYLIIDEISYRFHNPGRGDVIIFKYPKDPSQRFIKRIIGLPGETVEINDGKIIISQNNQNQILDEKTYIPDPANTYGNLRIVLSSNEYFVLGDNRNFSSDSRRWGAVPRENIIGKVFLRVFPLAVLSKIETPSY